MGMGFVLITALMVLLIIASLIGGILFLTVFLLNRKSKNKVTKSTYLALIPLKCIGISFLFLFVYVLICEYLRGVDPGIGDLWQVPLGDDYYFCMIDTPDMGFIQRSGCSGEPLIGGVTKITTVGDNVAGYSEGSEKGYFIFALSTGKINRYKDQSDSAVSLEAFYPGIESVEKFYFSARWGFWELLFLLFYFSIMIRLSALWYRNFQAIG